VVDDPLQVLNVAACGDLSVQVEFNREFHSDVVFGAAADSIVFESLEVEDEHVRQAVNLHGFECVHMFLALFALPLVLLVQLFSRTELVETVVDVQ